MSILTEGSPLAARISFRRNSAAPNCSFMSPIGTRSEPPPRA